MTRGRHATPVKLANKERQELLSLIERKTAAQRDVMRARIALWAHEGHANTVIAREPGGLAQTVCLWRRRIAQQGAQGIREGERSGRPPRITHEARLRLIAGCCTRLTCIDIARTAGRRPDVPKQQEPGRSCTRTHGSGCYLIPSLTAVQRLAKTVFSVNQAMRRNIVWPCSAGLCISGKAHRIHNGCPTGPIQGHDYHQRRHPDQKKNECQWMTNVHAIHRSTSYQLRTRPFACGCVSGPTGERLSAQKTSESSLSCIFDDFPVS